MAKITKSKSVFICTNCGYNSPKWEGKCKSCNEWNTLVEEIQTKSSSREVRDTVWKGAQLAEPKPLSTIESNEIPRMDSPDPELNRVLGGGIVAGSIVLIGGQPGIGKSTLMLQVALQITDKLLYVSGEESEEQIKMRADRIGLVPDTCFIYTETNITRLLKQAVKLKPKIVVIDSIQTLSSPILESTPGSVSQVRECAGELQRFAKETGIAVFIIGHITKEGNLAGPKLLEHIVDTVLQFEGDRNYTYRILRTLKNRFGSTDELGIYEMDAKGLRPVNNPSELLLSQKEDNLSGSAIGATLEGLRPMLIETQALVSPAVYGNPQRSATGFDLRRMGMLLAIIEKRLGLQFGQQDVFLNIAGGIKVNDPAIDLSILAALISSFTDIEIPEDVCFAAEVGLSGEIRGVARIEQRIQEAARLGFKRIFISKFNGKSIDPDRYDIRLEYIGKVTELYTSLFV